MKIENPGKFEQGRASWLTRLRAWLAIKLAGKNISIVTNMRSCTIEPGWNAVFIQNCGTVKLNLDDDRYREVAIDLGWERPVLH